MGGIRLYRHRRSPRLEAVVASTKALAIVFLLLGCEAEEAAAPISSSTLAARFEQFVESGAAQPATSAAALLERLGTLWELSNALALEGAPIPVDYPAHVKRNFLDLNKAGAEPDLEILERARDIIDRYSRELALKAKNPNAIGTLTLTPPGPFRVGELVTLSQTYTVGDIPMRPGGGIILTTNRGIAGQADDPSAENHVSVTSSRPEAILELAEPWGNWQSFINRTTLSWRLRDVNLEPGDTVTITYGTTLGGGGGARLQRWSNDRVIFPVHIDLEGKGELLTPHWPSVEVRGAREISHVNVIVPSRVAGNEPFDIAVRSEDNNKNLSSATTPRYRVLLEGKALRTIPAGSGALTVLEDIVLERPGVYRFEVRSDDRTLQALSNPIVVSADPELRVYWGETHGHSGFAEGQGSPDGYYRFGRDVARLDFASLSEHDLWLDDGEWLALKEAVTTYLEPGRFTAILGYEWTASNPDGGHHNVFFSDTADRKRVPVQETLSPEELYQRLRAENDPEDVLIIPHAHQSADWRKSDVEMERLAEIQSGHGTFEYFGNKYLQQGWEVGFIGASDNHNGHPGYSGTGNRQLGGLAAVLAPQNTPQAIFQALRDRATYATTGERIVLEATLNGSRMGTRVPMALERRLECRVHGTAPIDTIDVIKNGNVVFTRRFLEAQLRSSAFLQIKVESSAEVFTGHKNPRPARLWRGSVSVKGADLVDFKRPWYFNPGTFSLGRDEADTNRLELSTNTRGRGKGILLELSGANRDTTIVVEWDESREIVPRDGTTPEMMDREPQTLPAGTASFRLGDLEGGLGRKEIKVVENVDSIQLQLVPADAELDQEFEFVDKEDLAPGDYYYLRVTQVDGSMAWSSPWWVGSRPR